MGRTLSIILSLLIASFFLLLAFGLWNGIRTDIIPALEKAFPEKVLLVKPRTVALGNIRLDTELMTDDIITRIRKIEGVEYVSPQLTVTIPCRAISQIFGSEFSTDVVVIGVEKRVVAAYLESIQDFTYVPGKPIPALISQYFLNLYNIGLAESMGLPKFDGASAKHRKFLLILGESTLGEALAAEKTKTIECELLGFTPDISLIGLIIPYDAVNAFNAWYWGKSYTPKYSLLRVYVSSIEDIETITLKIEKMNLIASSHADELNRLRFNIRIVMMIVFLLVLAIGLIAGLNIINITGSIYRENLRDLVLLELLGLAPGQLLMFLSAHRFITGFIAGILGSAGAYGIAHVLNGAIGSALQNLPFIPEKMFNIPISAIIAMTVVSVFVNIFTTICVFSRSFFRLPAQMLKEPQP